MSLFKIFFKITLLFVLISFSLFEDLLSQPSPNEDQRDFIHLSNEYYVSDQSYYHIQNKKAEIRKEENRVIAEKERIALMEKELEIKAEEIFWDKVKTFFASLFFIGCAAVLIIRNLQIKRENKIKAEKERNLLEEEREERARKSELEAERQLKKGRTTRWMKKGRKIQREINSVKKSIETINKQDVTNNKQIERLESEKKLIEDNIDQLNKDIKGEKKVVSKLRKKYPFIDVYIANR